MKRLLLFCALLCSTAMAQETRLSLPYTRFILPNGLNVILHEDHSTPTVAVNLWYHVGSSREKPGRTGFAHLFEHILFEGSGHVPEGDFDRLLEAAGANNNGSTTNDRTNYFESMPSNALELALFLESDRMGYLLDAMSPAKVDGQRDVVKNERRQRVENVPYGRSWILLNENLYGADHPYHWPVIGYMEDLTAASYEDVVEFFKNYYAPGNASLVIAGDIDPVKTRALVEKWFADVKGGDAAPPQPTPSTYLERERRLILEDRVQLPRVYMAWLSSPSYTPGDAELDLLASVLAGGLNSRLYKRLVYDLQIAQDVSAFQSSNLLSSEFIIIATARSGHTLTELENVIQEEINRLKNEPPMPRELQRAVNQYEAAFLRQLESIDAKADQLNDYFMYTGNPDYLHEDLSRYKAVDTDDLRAVAQSYLRDDARVILSVVPEGKREMATTNGKEANP